MCVFCVIVSSKKIVSYLVSVESGYNVVRVSMRIVLRIGPPSYTILVRSCVSLLLLHGTMNIKFRLYCCLLCSVLCVFVSIFLIFLAARYLTVFRFFFVSNYVMAFSVSIINALIKCFGSLCIA